MRELHLLDAKLSGPAENLACEEALLDWCEAGEYGGPGILRFWESPTHFVVLGYANRLAQEVDEAECVKLQVPILRRCSGGGSVLQGPGCLNYALVLPINAAPELGTISEANQFIMCRQQLALAEATGQRVTVEGFTDLAIDGRKCSGNSQRRKREWLLFHGTFLCGLDVALVQQVLCPPPREPVYRRNRSHEAFMAQLEIEPAALTGAIARAWNATTRLTAFPAGRVSQLVAEKYSQPEWNRRW
jgi:lipoate-protein ligase A